MKRLKRLFVLSLLTVCIYGCATTGHTYDDAKIALIKKDVTTEADLLKWFGPAHSRTMGPDGSKSLIWKFPGAGGSPGKLDVRLGPDGKTTAYSASRSTR